MSTDFGKRGIELRAMRKVGILDTLGKLCGFDKSCLIGKSGRIKRTKESLVLSVLRIEAHKYDQDGMLLK